MQENELRGIVAKNIAALRTKNKIDKNEFAQINMIEPVYLRASQAEIERNKKLAKE